MPPDASEPSHGPTTSADGLTRTSPGRRWQDRIELSDARPRDKLAAMLRRLQDEADTSSEPRRAGDRPRRRAGELDGPPGAVTMTIGDRLRFLDRAADRR